MTALDASVLVAALDPEDPHHAEALVLLAQATYPYVIHEITVAECLVQAVRAGVEGPVEGLVRAWGDVVGSDGWEGGLRLARLRAATGLRMPDCCVLDAAVQHGTDIATFDRAVAREAAAIGIGVLGGAGA